MRTIDALHGAIAAWAAERVAAGLTPVPIGMAMVAGRIVFGAVGDETRLEYTVIGDPVNFCAKLEKHNRTARTHALTIRISFDLAVQQGYAAPDRTDHRDGVTIEGVAQPMDIVVLDPA